jgi:octaprenyl-diphosphate synthase
MWGEVWRRVVEPVCDHLLATEAVLEAEMAGVDVILADDPHPTLQEGGKRIRPLLLLLVAATGRPRWAAAHVVACAVEMIHTASLLHDDVLDDAVVRRGAPTLCATVGAKRAVLAGDVLYTRALEACLREGLHHPAFLLAGAARQMSESEALQTSRDGDLSWSVSDYMDIVRRKTGSLFAAATAAGAYLTGREGLEGALSAFGLHLGTAFQIVDDVLDYLPERPGWGKHRLSDLRQRRATLPILMAHEAGALESWPAPAEAYRVLRDCGALEGALGVAREEAGLARTELQGLSHGSARDALLQLAGLVVDRTT